MESLEEHIVNQKIGLKEKIRRFFAHEFFRNSLTQWTSLAVIFLNISSWVILAIFIHPVDYPIHLHYNVYFGIDVDGAWWLAYFVPLVGIVLFLINFLLAFHFFHQKERIASYLLLLTSIIVQIGLIIAGVSLVIVN